VPERRRRLSFHRLPIRLRLASSVATVVLGILVVVAVAVGTLVAHRLRSDFDNQVNSQAQSLANDVHPTAEGARLDTPNFVKFASISGGVATITLDGSTESTNPAVNLGLPSVALHQSDGFMVATATASSPLSFGAPETVYIEYGLPVATVAGEIGNLELLLVLCVVLGTAIAFGAGAIVARRAIAPIAALTAAAGEIERTRDPSRTLPAPTAEDEVAELSRTLSGMLASLSAARDETEATLERQRAFVGDASHELRTPLTSVLANLELLVESLQGADRDAAVSALRSTRRMRRLVGDLLLLARTDARQVPPRVPLDLSEVVVDAASELEAVSRDHLVDLDIQPTPTFGSRDELQRVATNLIENALRHTPPGTHVTASTRALADGSAELVVADDGPGITPELRPRLFARFVRGAGDRGGSFGLGLSIVAAVTEAHGGTVVADDSPHGGARFTVRLPPAPGQAEEGQPASDPPAAAEVDSTGDPSTAVAAAPPAA
jgi:signal transduction histidine kinase